MQAFLIGLQFLTRINVVKQTVWTEEDFGKSVRYFPLVGAVLGSIYGGLAWLVYDLLPGYGGGVFASSFNDSLFCGAAHPFNWWNTL